MNWTPLTDFGGLHEKLKLNAARAAAALSRAHQADFSRGLAAKSSIKLKLERPKYADLQNTCLLRFRPDQRQLKQQKAEWRKS